MPSGKLQSSSSTSVADSANGLAEFRRTTRSRKAARWALVHGPVDPCDRPHGGKDPSKRCREAVWLAVAIS